MPKPTQVNLASDHHHHVRWLVLFSSPIVLFAAIQPIAPYQPIATVQHYAYVQPFRIDTNAKGNVDPDVQLYRLVRILRSDRTRKGLIVPLTDIWRPVELVPRFGVKCNVEWTYDTAVECSKEFYLNCFADKATYIEVY